MENPTFKSDLKKKQKTLHLNVYLKKTYNLASQVTAHTKHLHLAVQLTSARCNSHSQLQLQTRHPTLG